MLDPLSLSIGIGLVVSLCFAELFGLSAAGMIVPGYFALNMTHLPNVCLTVFAAIVTSLIIRLLSNYLIIFGRRRIALTILIAFLVGLLLRHGFESVLALQTFGAAYQVIGFIIPGLIAISIDRHGMIETITSVLTTSVVVRLILILIIPKVLLA